MMESSNDFKSIQDRIQSALVAVTRSTNQIAAEDLNFHRTSNPAVEEELDSTDTRLLDLTTSLLKSAAKNTNVAPPTLEDTDDVDVHWSRIVDVVDNLLEKADTCLDEYTGLIKRKNAPTDLPGPSQKKSRAVLDSSLRRANVLKPQNTFEVKPDNSNTSPWTPVITNKPHSIVPLEQSFGTLNDENMDLQRKHPYETEIAQLEYPDFVFQKAQPITYQPMEATAATFVDTYEGVLEMLDELKEASVIAIDTEHHDYRTYSGLLSLMQISTRDKDWIVDTLLPWRHKLQVLNEVFADPKIVKILHGAYMDIVWLQRDLGLYVVGLFDTYEASCALEYPSRSLAYLLKKFINFDADKQYQLADWRIRPLPEQMFYYARSDTHFLLYIYDMIRNELLEKSTNDSEDELMRRVLDKSKETSLRRYEKAAYDAESGSGPSGWFNLILKHSSGTMSKEQFAVFRAVHQWRDEIARREDESPLYVMANAAVFDIARRLPPDPKALHSLLGSASHFAKREVTDLFEITTEAQAAGSLGPSVAEILRRGMPSTTGIGEVAQRVFPSLRKAPSVSTEDLVSHKSKLWGDVPVSSRWEEQPAINMRRDTQFHLPWAQFIESSQIVTGPNDWPDSARAAAEEPAKPSANIATPTQGTVDVPNIAEDSEFTLKAGLKRKAPETDSNSESDEDIQATEDSQLNADVAMDADEIAVPSSSDSEERKKSKKAVKKAQKRARKEARDNKEARKERKRAKRLEMHNKSSAEEKKGDDEDEPFDYSKAQSVLNAKRNKTNGHGKQQKKFNPYGLTADGPKPARRMHGEKPGKSATFRR
ncbi:ribonuclease H-like domain-containing protein [Xylariomycetidae sp. FL2044]|nr:ribonuclease H-like domain-containing protein [Xylariomycetidae sp. FL2044]